MMTRNVMKRKPENAAETADEKEPALKKRSCVNVKCKMEDNARILAHFRIPALT